MHTYSPKHAHEFIKTISKKKKHHLRRKVQEKKLGNVLIKTLTW